MSYPKAKLNVYVLDDGGTTEKLESADPARAAASRQRAQALKAAGNAVTTGIAGTGVVGVLNGGKPGKTVMVRADMDALVHPIGGKDTAVHSCGHDAHCAMVLTMAEAVAADVKGGATFPGRLKILFQPAEEKLNGALSVIEANAIFISPM